MASKQTRRSVSISGDTYARLKLWCAENGKTMSGSVEECLSAYLLDDRKSKIKERVSARNGNVRH